MEKKNIKKALLTVVLALVLVFTTVMGTLAYLTSQEVVTNTFTVGNVKITLDEAKVNEKGEPQKAITDAEGNVTGYAKAGENDVVARVTPAAVNDQVYHLVPGRVLTKDPTVTLLGGSEQAYVRAIVKITTDTVLSTADLNALLACIDLNTNWVKYDDGYKTENNTHILEYRYNAAVSPAPDGDDEDTVTEDFELPAIFTKITVNPAWDNDDLAKYTGLNINITAQAIQTETFADAAAAWTAFETQFPEPDVDQGGSGD